MTVWLIQPRDPLIFRDGRPFNTMPGARARTLAFPYPSTLAGGVRSRAGQDSNGRFDVHQPVDRLLRYTIRGPLLVSLDDHGDVTQWHFPAPADAFVIEAAAQSTVKRRWVRPVHLPYGAATDLQNGVLVSADPAVRGKADTAAPSFWSWETVEAWLAEPGDDPAPVSRSTLGLGKLVRESRVHVSIDPKTQTASEGLLYETTGIEFVANPSGEGRGALSAVQQYALAVDTDARLQPGVDFLGGERRVVNWAASRRSFPDCPQGIRNAIVGRGYCRVLLATPAIFEGGYLPSWLTRAVPGLTVRVVAVANRRYGTVSGWDAKRGTQKATRRLAPAGSVYFLSLDGDPAARERFVDLMWLQAVSDEEQDRRDGFGMALLGTWNGEIQPLEAEDEDTSS